MPNGNIFQNVDAHIPGILSSIHPRGGGREEEGHCVGFGLGQSPASLLPLYLVTMAGLTKRVVVTAEMVNTRKKKKQNKTGQTEIKS